MGAVTPAPARGGVVARSPRAPASYTALLALVAYPALVKAAASHALPDALRPVAVAAAPGWTTIALVVAGGLAGTALALRAGFPTTWDPLVSLRDRLFFPVSAGFALGALAALVDALTGWSRLAAAQMGVSSIHLAWPASLLVYPADAIVASVVYALLPLPLLLWVASRLGAGVRAGDAAFIATALLLAAVEPLARVMPLHAHPAITLALLAQRYVLGVVQLWVFRRSGFGATVALRATWALVWHVLWPAL